VRVRRRGPITAVLSPSARVPDVLALVFAVGAAAGCYRPPLVPFSLDTPPLILAPASAAGVTDSRGRFREI